MKIHDLLDLYLRLSTVRPASETAYRLAVRMFVTEAGEKRIGEYNEQDCVCFRDNITGRATPITYNTYRRHLAALFNFAVKREMLTRSPFTHVKSIRVLQKRPKTIQESVITQIMDYLQGLDELSAPPRLQPVIFWKTCILTLCFTGMRRRQILALRWTHIDFHRNVINLASEGSKNYREWDIPLPEPLVKPLFELRKKYVEHCGPSGGKVFNLAVFLPPDQKKPNMANRLRIAIDEIGEKLGADLSPHKFRHTVATLLVRKYRDIVHAQRILGHTDVRTTMIYVEADTESMRNMLDNLHNTTTQQNLF